MKFMAGPKLRAKAIKRTIEHIEREERALINKHQGTWLARQLNGMHDYSLSSYIQDERRRLSKLRGEL